MKDNPHTLCVAGLVHNKAHLFWNIQTDNIGLKRILVDGTLADKNGMEILLNEEVQNETVLFGKVYRWDKRTYQRS